MSQPKVSDRSLILSVQTPTTVPSTQMLHLTTAVFNCHKFLFRTILQPKLTGQAGTG